MSRMSLQDYDDLSVDRAIGRLLQMALCFTVPNSGSPPKPRHRFPDSLPAFSGNFNRRTSWKSHTIVSGVDRVSSLHSLFHRFKTGINAMQGPPGSSQKKQTLSKPKRTSTSPTAEPSTSKPSTSRSSTAKSTTPKARASSKDIEESTKSIRKATASSRGSMKETSGSKNGKNSKATKKDDRRPESNTKISAERDGSPERESRKERGQVKASFPLTRIKMIMKSAPEVNTLGVDAVALTARAAVSRLLYNRSAQKE